MGKKFWKWNNSVDSKNSELILEGPISDVTWWGVGRASDGSYDCR